MGESKSPALPLGDGASCKTVYHIFRIFTRGTGMFSSARRQIFFPENFWGFAENLAKLLRLWYAVGAQPFKAVPECRPRRAGTASAAWHGYSRESEEFYEKIFRALTLCLSCSACCVRQCLPPLPQEIKRTPFIPSAGRLRRCELHRGGHHQSGRQTDHPAGVSHDGRLHLQRWYTEPVGGSRITTATVFTGDTTIYAQWTAKSSSARPTTPTLPVTGGPALQKHLGTCWWPAFWSRWWSWPPSDFYILEKHALILRKKGIPIYDDRNETARLLCRDRRKRDDLSGRGATIADSDAYKAFLNVGQVLTSWPASSPVQAPLSTTSM